MLQTLHEDPKESSQLVENGHPMTPCCLDIGTGEQDKITE